MSPTVTGPGAVDQVAALAQAQQSVNARTTAPRIVALAAVSPGTATEGFEGGMTDWQNWGNAQVVAGAGTAGSSALQVGTGAGGAGLVVPGVAAGTPYRFTAQVKVSDPSETVFIGINMLSPDGSFVGGQSGPAVTGTAYATITVDLVAPRNSANAVVWIWKNAGSGFGYLDDVSFGPATSAPPPPGPPGSNLVSNGGFESGMADWINWGNATVVSGQASSGTSALQVGAAGGGAGHDVNGIVPGTTYRLVAQAKVSDPSETVFLGVNLLNAAGAAVAQKALPTSSTSYGTLTLDITAPADAVSAVVFVWKNAGSGFGYVDDVAFGDASGSAPPSGNLVANGGFENGLANWVNWGNTIASTDQAAAGSFAAQVGTGAGGFGQDIGGIVAGTTYRLSGLVKVSVPGEIGFLAVRFMDGAGTSLLEQAAVFSSATYSVAHLDLVAPANATRALVYVWKNAGSGFAYLDEISLTQVTAATPSPEQVGPPPASVPRVVQLANGGRVVAWNSTNGALAQVFDANGAKDGAPVAFGGGLSGVGALPDGSFIVATVTGAVVSGTPLVRLFMQKVSSTGQLLATGGTSDPSVNGGLADMLLSENLANTIGFNDSAIYGNADGSYVVETTRITHPVPLSFNEPVLVDVAGNGNVIGTATVGSSLNAFPTPATRLGNGNFLVVLGNGSPFQPPAVAWAVVTSSGQTVAGQSFAAPGSSTSNPQVTTLADGSGLLTWQFANATGTGWAAERIDGNGNVIATLVPPTRAGAVTGLAQGGWVQTWISGTQLLAQYFASSGQAVGAPFLVADNLAVTPNVATYSVAATSDGFVAACTITTAAGPEVDEVRFTAPPSLN